IGLLAFALAIAILLSPLRQLVPLELLLLAGLAGGLTAVTGTVYFGQANLLVFLALALAARGSAAPLMVAIAGAVKLSPASAFVALASRGRVAVRPLISGIALLAVLVIGPNLLLGIPGSGRTD